MKLSDDIAKVMSPDDPTFASVKERNASLRFRAGMTVLMWGMPILKSPVSLTIGA